MGELRDNGPAVLLAGLLADMRGVVGRRRGAGLRRCRRMGQGFGNDGRVVNRTLVVVEVGVAGGDLVHPFPTTRVLWQRDDAGIDALLFRRELREGVEEQE